MDTSGSPAPAGDDFSEHPPKNTSKRQRHMTYGPGSDDSEGSDGNGKVETTLKKRPKRLRTSTLRTSLPCPYRKRNPLRFNVRSHGSCALNSFADMALLKRHIKTVHLNSSGRSTCVRCKERFSDQEALRDHVSRREICELKHGVPQDPEDGMTEEVDRKLKVRTKEDMVRDWDTLWRVLFPMDGPLEIPGPEFEPPIELDQVEADFFAQENLDELQREFHRNTNDSTTSFYFCVNYITTILSRCRGKNYHSPSSRRRQAEEDYLARAAAAMRYNIRSHKDSDSSSSALDSGGSEPACSDYDSLYLETDVPKWEATHNDISVPMDKWFS